jgi:PHP family Zn ribbon phosphoesterase
MMNWQIKDLQKRAILSFSDAHSGQKLGREATVFVENNDSTISNSSYSFFDISNAIKQKPNGRFKIGYTIEFFPEEGKYHWSGHRNCNIRYSPKEVIQKGPICPICHHPLTIGVENQILAMAQLPLKKEDLLLSKNKNQVTFVGDPQKKHRPFVSLVPLLEILVEINQGSQTKGLHQYEEILKHKSEFDLLLKTPLEEIAKIGGEKLRQAITIVRNRQVFVNPGYDGVFGKVKIFPPENNNNEKTTKEEKQQLNLF